MICDEIYGDLFFQDLRSYKIYDIPFFQDLRWICSFKIYGHKIYGVLFFQDFRWSILSIFTVLQD